MKWIGLQRWAPRPLFLSLFSFLFLLSPHPHRESEFKRNGRERKSKFNLSLKKQKKNGVVCFGLLHWAELLAWPQAHNPLIHQQSQHHSINPSIWFSLSACLLFAEHWRVAPPIIAPRANKERKTKGIPLLPHCPSAFTILHSSHSKEKNEKNCWIAEWAAA